MKKFTDFLDEVARENHFNSWVALSAYYNIESATEAAEVAAKRYARQVAIHELAKQLGRSIMGINPESISIDLP